MSDHVTTEEEALNCIKVKKMLLDIPGLAVKNLREDLFLITEPESGVQLTADVESATLFLRSEVAEVPEGTDSAFYKMLLTLNADTVHVAFGLEGNTLVIKGNLEIENLDANELEASCKSLIVTLYQSSDEIAKYIGN